MTGSKDCLFCKIAGNEIPSERIFENDRFFAIRDIQPQAKKHFLVIPKEHVASLATALPEKKELMGELFAAGVEVAKREGLLPDGFRSVINTNQYGGQTVFHIHLHILGGEPLRGSFGS